MDTATTEIYTLSLHDALPISTAARSSSRAPTPTSTRPTSRKTPSRPWGRRRSTRPSALLEEAIDQVVVHHPDWKSTRLNSSHANISYAVFCLKKKKKIKELTL